ncbi:peroxidase 24-like [Malania oleifera]|uniref:peroxidase 24-like n=1 Tax=Malania oleifera TaxID=397392 RepID=UPI0025ADA79F|nr:peroxidase 24-like [Malania oleifera]
MSDRVAVRCLRITAETDTHRRKGLHSGRFSKSFKVTMEQVCGNEHGRRAASSVAACGDLGTNERLSRLNFYQNSCPRAEPIVQNIVWENVYKNQTLRPKLLRMHFHDCFVNGCDASILLDSTPNNTAEKDSFPNQSMGGYEVIQEAKTKLETVCPGVVSCADIIALAARDAVSFQYKKSLWQVELGRRDGKISRASEVLLNVISPFSNFSTGFQSFKNKGLDKRDLVSLLGGHTLGSSHCLFFEKRIDNFTGKGDRDHSLNASYAAWLKHACANRSDKTTTVGLDLTPATFDTNYYENLKLNMGLFQLDAALITDEEAAEMVDEMLDLKFFLAQFGVSMRNMGRIGVLTGNSGEVRKECNTVN